MSGTIVIVGVLIFLAISFSSDDLIIRDGKVDCRHNRAEIKAAEIKAAPKLSCKDAILKNRHATDGFYKIDPDGLKGEMEAFDVYCNMTVKNGGWALFANHRDSMVTVNVHNKLGIKEPGVIGHKQWRALLKNMVTGMMFIDEHGRVSTISKQTLKNGNCRSVQNVSSLSHGNGKPIGHIWHKENDCSSNNSDYSFINLEGEDYKSYRIAGAALYNASPSVDFVDWPYRSDASYNYQNCLLYYIK